jgi:hypothetical protein
VTVAFHPLAERELIAVAKFYERRASGLGADFVYEVERTLTEIVCPYVIVERFAVAETGAGFPLTREAVRDSFASFALLTSFRMTE